MSGFWKWIRDHRARLVIAAAACAGIFMVQHWFFTLFGAGTWGSGGNMVAWVICGVIAFTWQHRQNVRLHNLRMALAKAQHAEVLQQARNHHEAIKDHIVTTLNGNAGAAE